MSQLCAPFKICNLFMPSCDCGDSINIALRSGGIILGQTAVWHWVWAINWFFFLLHIKAEVFLNNFKNLLWFYSSSNMYKILFEWSRSHYANTSKSIFIFFSKLPQIWCQCVMRFGHFLNERKIEWMKMKHTNRKTRQTKIVTCNCRN